MLEDCKHIFEAGDLERWLSTRVNSDDNGRIEIGMKKCPRCSISIYNTKRYQKAILESYSMVLMVKRKYFSSKKKIQKHELKKSLKGMLICCQKKRVTVLIQSLFQYAFLSDCNFIMVCQRELKLQSSILMALQSLHGLQTIDPLTNYPEYARFLIQVLIRIGRINSSNF